MTLSLKEVRDIISNAAFVHEVNNFTYTISYPYLNMEFEMTTNYFKTLCKEEYLVNT